MQFTNNSMDSMWSTTIQTVKEHSMYLLISLISYRSASGVLSQLDPKCQKLVQVTSNRLG